MREQPAEDDVEGMGLEFEGCGDPEVAAATAQPPEQIGLVVGIDDAHLTVGRHHLDLHDVVDGQAVLAHQPSDPSTKRETGHTSGGDHPARRRLPVDVGRPVVLLPGHTPLRTGAAPSRIDVHPPHQREVDHQPALGHGSTGHVVTSAAHRDLQAALTPKAHRVTHVGHVVAARDETRALVDQTVVHGSHLVVARIVGQQQRAVERSRQLSRHGHTHPTPPHPGAMAPVDPKTRHPTETSDAAAARRR